MQTHIRILESLKRAKAQIALKKSKILEAVDPVMGQKYKFLKSTPHTHPTEVYSVISVPKDPNKENIVLLKVKNDGTLGSMSTKGNMIGVSVKNMDKWLNDGTAKLLGDDEVLTSGEVTLDEVKRILINFGIDTLIGKSINLIVKSSGIHIVISMGDSSVAITQPIYIKIIKALATKNIKPSGYSATYSEDMRRIYLEKVQV